jgi:dTDP-4-dehydrorhamnose 3,5-epimerase
VTVVQPSIDGVRFVPLRRIDDDRGSVMHMLKSTDDWFVGFGEIYFSTVRPGAVKAWRRHLHMTTNLAVPVGTVRVLLVDERSDSATSGAIADVSLGEGNYGLLIVPPLVWSGFYNDTASTVLVANCASIPHDPDEVERRDAHDSRMPQPWSIPPA